MVPIVVHVSMTQYNDAMLWAGHYLKRYLFEAFINLKQYFDPAFIRRGIYSRGVYSKKYGMYYLINEVFWCHNVNFTIMTSCSTFWCYDIIFDVMPNLLTLWCTFWLNDALFYFMPYFWRYGVIFDIITLTAWGKFNIITNVLKSWHTRSYYFDIIVFDVIMDVLFDVMTYPITLWRHFVNHGVLFDIMMYFLT